MEAAAYRRYALFYVHLKLDLDNTSYIILLK